MVLYFNRVRQGPTYSGSEVQVLCVVQVVGAAENYRKPAYIASRYGRVGYPELVMGDPAERHAQWERRHNDRTRSQKFYVEHADKHTGRADYLEQMLGDSAGKHFSGKQHMRSQQIAERP